MKFSRINNILGDVTPIFTIQAQNSIIPISSPISMAAISNNEVEIVCISQSPSCRSTRWAYGDFVLSSLV